MAASKDAPARLSNPAANQKITRLTSYVIRVLFAFVATGAAIALTHVIPVLGLKAPFLLPLATLAVCAWYGGVIAGVASYLLTVCVLVILFYTSNGTTDDLRVLTAQIIVYGIVAGIVILGLERHRRDSEAPLRLAALVESSEDAIVGISPDGIITSWNLGAAHTYGYQADQVVGRPVTLLIPSGQSDQVSHSLERLKRGESIETYETVWQRQDGSPVDVALRVSPICDKAGRIVGASTVVRDISQRKKVEESLREALRRIQQLNQDLAERNAQVESERARWQGVVEGIAEEVWVCDAQGRMSLMNLAAVTAMGLEEFKDKPLAKVLEEVEIFNLNGQVRPAAQDPLLRSLRGEVVRGEEILRHRRTGKTRYRHYSSAPLRDAAGAITGAVSIVRDITEEKRIEEALRESEEKYRTLFNSMTEGFTLNRAIHDAQGQLYDLLVVDANPAAEVVNNLTRSELIGRTWRQLWPGAEEYWWNICNKVLQEGEHVHYENYAALHERWYAVHHFSAGKDLVGSTFTDVTERKRSEAEREELLRREQTARAEAERNADRVTRLQTVTAALSEALTPTTVAEVVLNHGLAALGGVAGAIAVLDETGQNLQVLHAVGYTEELLKNWTVFPITASAPLARSVRDRQPIFLDSPEALNRDYPELSGQARSDSQAWLSVPLMVEGHPIGGLGISFDQPRQLDQTEIILVLTLAQQCAQALERARLYEAEKGAREKAEAALGLRDQFISLAAHELRTPLTSALGYAQLLNQRLSGWTHLPENERRMLRSIEQQTRRLNDMVTELLDISRLERGQLTLERAPVELGALLESIVEQTRPALRKHTLEVKNSAGSVWIDGDELRLGQVIQNLIQNAIKYSPFGGPVKVQLSKQDGVACLAVSDRGIGIPSDALPQLFTRFYRAPNTERHHISGLGVGLYVVREIVQLHGGKIRVESEEDKGSTFTVYLPEVGAKHLPQRA